MELTNSALKAEIRALLGAPVATTAVAPAATKAVSAPAPAPAVVVKAPPKKRGPSRWNRYVSYLTETLTAADPDYKKTPFAERQAQAAALKEDPEEGMHPTNLAFEAWLAAHPLTAEATDDSSSDSGAQSTASDGAKKRGRPKGTKLTDEQKAKAAATRAANKAAKAAAAGAPAGNAEDSAGDLTPFEVDGVTYYRLATGHSWIESGDDMVYVGLYVEAMKSFDKSVADPTA
jgi:hypothetical protein